MDAARAHAIERGWDRVRMGAVAIDAGMSRPTLYKLFGDKEGLGRAMVLREASRFISGVVEALNTYDSEPERAIQAAMMAAIAEGQDNRLLAVVLAPGSAGPSELLRMLTTDSQPILAAVGMAVMGWADRHYPRAPAGEKLRVIEFLARSTVSMLVLAPMDAHKSTETIAGMAVAWLEKCQATRQR